MLHDGEGFITNGFPERSYTTQGLSRRGTDETSGMSGDSERALVGLTEGFRLAVCFGRGTAISVPDGTGLVSMGPRERALATRRDDLEGRFVVTRRAILAVAFSDVQVGEECQRTALPAHGTKKGIS